MNFTRVRLDIIIIKFAMPRLPACVSIHDQHVYQSTRICEFPILSCVINLRHNHSLNANTRYSQQKNHSQVAIVPKTQTVIRNFNDQHVTAVYKNKREGLSPSGKWSYM